MTPDDGFDRLLSSWFRTEASEQQPAGFHAAAMTLAGRARQRPRWMVAVSPGRPLMGADVRMSRRRTAVLLAGLALLLAALAAVVGGSPKVSPQVLPLSRNGSIAYGVEHAGAENQPAGPVHLIDADGTNDRVIGDGRCPTFSPDGTQLVRWTGPHPQEPSGQGTLMITAADGGAQRIITKVAEGPIALSPDGTQVAWLRPTSELSFDAPDGSSYGFEVYELWVSPLSGAPGSRLVATTLSPGQPFWSPDGRSIAFASMTPATFTSDQVTQFTSDQGTYVGTYRSAIYVMDATGGEPRVLTTRPGWDDSMAWSPDGKSVAYAGVPDVALAASSLAPGPSSTDTYSAAPAGLDGPMDLFVIAADGSTETDITPASEGAATRIWVRDLRWAPDGARLAWLEYQRTLAVQVVQPGTAGTVVRSPGVDGYTWSPDGRQIAAYSTVYTFLGTDPQGRELQEVQTTIRTIPQPDGTPWSFTFHGSPSCAPSWQALPGR